VSPASNARLQKTLPYNGRLQSKLEKSGLQPPSEPAGFQLVGVPLTRHYVNSSHRSSPAIPSASVILLGLSNEANKAAGEE
jgi:hypothetical protein